MLVEEGREGKEGFVWSDLIGGIEHQHLGELSRLRCGEEAIGATHRCRILWRRARLSTHGERARDPSPRL